MVEVGGQSSVPEVGGVVYTPLPDGFAQLPGGAWLGASLRGVDRAALNGYQLVELVRARYRQLSHDHAELLRDLAELSRVPRRGWSPSGRVLCGGPEDPPTRTDGEELDIVDEVAFALALTTSRAEDLVELAVQARRFPRVLDALSDGRVDLAKARVLVDETDLCQSEERDRIIDAALAGVESRTAGSLRDRIRRLVYRVDPDSVHKRYQKAVRERGVELRSHRDGTASLHGWALPPDQAVAAMDYLSRMAEVSVVLCN